MEFLNEYFQYISFIITILSVIGVFLGIKSSLGKDINKLDNRIDKLDNRLRDVEKDVATIKGQLSVVSGSPLRLAEGGKQIIKDIDGQKIIDDNFKSLSIKISKLNPENRYQKLDFTKKVIGNDFYNLIPEDKQDILFNQGHTKNATINALTMLMFEKP